MKKYFYLLAACCMLCIRGNSQSDSIAVDVKKNGTIFLSRDQGESWLQADKGFSLDASVNALALSSNTVIAATAEHGIFISEDGLKSWHPSNKGLLHNAKINALASFQNLVLAGSYRDGVYISYDNGASWEQSNKGLDNLTVRCFYTQGSIVFVGTDIGIYFSANQGKTWTLATLGMQINEFTSLQGILFAATNQGALRSEDSGRTWSWAWKKSALFNIAADGQYIVSVVPFISEDRILLAGDYGRDWMRLDPNFSHYTFRITPSSRPMLISPWRKAFKSLRENKPFRYDGLPERSSFTEILVTPYGILVAVSFGGC